MPTARRAVRVVAAGLPLALMACAGPSRTDDDFRHKAANTAESMQGFIGTAQVAVDAASHNRVPGPYLSVTLAETDDDASAVMQAFDSVQPPSSDADDLRDRLDTLMQRVVSILDELRIEVRRGDIDRLADIAKPLDELDQKLEPIVDLA